MRTLSPPPRVKSAHGHRQGLRRLPAGAVRAGRAREFAAKDNRRIVLQAALAYRDAMANFAAMNNLEVWYARFGRTRNLALVGFGQLEHVRFGAPVDLLVCSDVLHYVPAAELARGLSGFAELCHGVAFVDLYTKDDRISGDLRGFQPRTAAWYRKRFKAAGLTACGSNGYLTPAIVHEATALEVLPL
jgi:hypothetical protein